MDKIKAAFAYLEGSQNVADFQKFCGVEVYTKTESNGCVAPKLDDNGVVPQHGETDMPTDLNSLKHRMSKNGYSKVENGCVNGTIRPDLQKNGLDVSSLRNKNGCVKNGIDIHNQIANELTVDSSETKFSYKVHNKPLHYVFHLGASLGNEIFYLIFFPLVMWNLDSSLLRETVIVWHTGMYLGQASKDIIRRPRPSFPAVPLEDRYAKEYGMPSTHAIVGAVIPFSLFIISYGRYQYPFVLGLTLALSWTITVGLSRIYLGMHSAMDVICGLLTACVLMPCMLPFVEWFDHLQVTHPFAPVVTVLGSFLLCFVYPPLIQWSTARGDTATVHGIGSGISFGMWLNNYMGWMYVDPSANGFFQIKAPTLHFLALCLVRTAVGVVILALLRIVIKKFLISSLCFLHGVEKNDTDGMRKKWFEVPQKFFTYFTMSVGAVFAIPALLSYMGVMREAFYTEF